MDFEIVQGVKCETCGKLHEFDSDTFIAIYGNVTVGSKSGLYGNADNTKVSVFCRNMECMSKLIDKLSIDQKSDVKYTIDVHDDDTGEFEKFQDEIKTKRYINDEINPIDKTEELRSESTNTSTDTEDLLKDGNNEDNTAFDESDFD